MTFSVPEDTLVTIKGDFWLRSLPDTEMQDPYCIAYNVYFCETYTFKFCDPHSPFCSPSLAVAQGDLDYKFDQNRNVLQIAKPAIVGWSSFDHTFKTRPGSSHVTLYLMQESSGPLSSSYFANLKIMSTRVKPVPAAISLPAEEPLAIDCNLDNWKVHNAFLSCGLAHEGRDNVLEVSDDGSW